MSVMKRILASIIMLLGAACVLRAQELVPPPPIHSANAAPDFSATSASRATLLDPFLVPETATFRTLETSAASLSLANTLLAEPAPAAPPAPSPKPKFIYGGRDDYRWQLSLGATWLRFRSSVFNASAIGVQTAVTYFLNDWLGVEGNVTAAFAPTILQNEHVKLAVYGGGVKIAWRQKRWEPWMHGIFGGAHEQPQIAGQTRSSYSIQGGGGADYRWNPRVSFRLEGDYVRTAFFSKSQNNFQLTGAIVFHF